MSASSNCGPEFGSTIETAHRRGSSGAERSAPGGGPSPADRPSDRRPLAVWISTVFGVGYAPLAPGTFGSAVAVFSFPFIARSGVVAALLAIACVTLLGVWASERSEPYFGKADDGRIVIDEVAGQWIALLPVFLVANGQNSHELPGNPHQLEMLVTGFVLFRSFDIWKPGPVGWAERRFRGGVGVMADDIVAGALAAIVLAIAFASGVFEWLGSVA